MAIRGHRNCLTSWGRTLYASLTFAPLKQAHTFVSARSLRFVLANNSATALTFLARCRPARFEDPWADEETVTWHPEKDVLAYLETCASELGLALDREAKTRALRRLRSITLDEDTAVAPASSRPGTSSPPAAGKTPGGGVPKYGTAKRDGGEKSRHESASVSSAQDIYAAVANSMSQALVHCTRFEVCCYNREKGTVQSDLGVEGKGRGEGRTRLDTVTFL